MPPGSALQYERLFAPYVIELAGLDFSCYVIGMDGLRGEHRILTLERIHQARLTDERFTLVGPLDVDRHPPTRAGDPALASDRSHGWDGPPASSHPWEGRDGRRVPLGVGGRALNPLQVLQQNLQQGHRAVLTTCNEERPLVAIAWAQDVHRATAQYQEPAGLVRLLPWRA